MTRLNGPTWRALSLLSCSPESGMLVNKPVLKAKDPSDQSFHMLLFFNIFKVAK